MTIINESGLYSLIFASKLNKAKQFKHWVTSEVLPTIRKTGGYNAANSAATLETLQRIEHRLDALEAKATLTSRWPPSPRPALPPVPPTVSDTNVTFTEFADMLNRAGIKTGRAHLIQYFRDNDYITQYKSFPTYPTQHSQELGLFTPKLFPKLSTNGIIKYYPHPRTMLLTPRGQQYFIDIFFNRA